MSSNYAVSISNLRTLEQVDAQYTPPTLREKVQAVFSGLEVLGYSHQPQQFRFTQGYRVEGLEFRYDARSSKRGFTPAKVEAARRFFLALQYAPKGDDVLSGSPDQCLVVWPNIFVLTCYVVLEELQILETFTDGRVRRFVARVSLVQVSENRILPETISAHGPGDASGGLDRLAGG